MELNTTKLVAAGALVGFLGFGGASLAGAQETPTTTEEEATESTETPSEDPATADGDREGCDESDDTAEDGAEAPVEGSSL